MAKKAPPRPRPAAVDLLLQPGVRAALKALRMRRDEQDPLLHFYGCSPYILKLARAMAKVFAGENAAQHRPIVEAWLMENQACIDVAEVDVEDLFADYCKCYSKAKDGGMGGELVGILRDAIEAGIPECVADDNVFPPLAQKLAALCRELQRRQPERREAAIQAKKKGKDIPGDAFFLNQQAAGAALAEVEGRATMYSYRAVGGYLGLLIAKGIIERTYEGHTRKSGEYLYRGDD